MATKAQILANRRNAKKSTGPRTRKGKEIVSQNAITHGLTARRIVISSENQADFDTYRQRFLCELAPQSPVQYMLAERIISLSWRLIRADRIQDQVIDALQKDNQSNPLTKLTRSILFKHLGQAQNSLSEQTSDLALGRIAIKDFSSAKVLERLLMYEKRIEYSLYRTMNEFQRLQIIKKINTEWEIPLEELAF